MRKSLATVPFLLLSSRGPGNKQSLQILGALDEKIDGQPNTVLFPGVTNIFNYSRFLHFVALELYGYYTFLKLKL